MSLALALTLLTLVCMVTYTVEIVFGLAGTILMVMIMSLVIDTKTLVIYSVMPQLMVAGIGLARSPRTVQWPVLMKMLLFAAAGGVLGLLVFYRLPGELFHLLLAITISLFGIYLVLTPGRLPLGPVLQRGLDTLAGASQALFGISGPIMMTRLMSSYDDKLTLRNYALAFFLSMNLFRLGGYVVNQTIDEQVWRMMAVSAAPIFLTLWFSNHLHLKINDRLFRKGVAWLILFGGISMLLPHIID